MLENLLPITYGTYLGRKFEVYPAPIPALNGYVRTLETDNLTLINDYVGKVRITYKSDEYIGFDTLHSNDFWSVDELNRFWRFWSDVVWDSPRNHYPKRPTDYHWTLEKVVGECLSIIEYLEETKEK